MKLTEVKRAEQVILDLLGKRAYRPSDLVIALRGQDLDELALREAMWRLIDRMQIRLTQERQLTLSGEQYARA